MSRHQIEMLADQAISLAPPVRNRLDVPHWKQAPYDTMITYLTAGRMRRFNQLPIREMLLTLAGELLVRVAILDRVDAEPGQQVLLRKIMPEHAVVLEWIQTTGTDGTTVFSENVTTAIGSNYVGSWEFFSLYLKPRFICPLPPVNGEEVCSTGVDPHGMYWYWNEAGQLGQGFKVGWEVDVRDENGQHLIATKIRDDGHALEIAAWKAKIWRAL